MALTYTKVIDNSVYLRKAVADATTAFRDYCSVEAVRLGDSKAELTLTVKTAHATRAREVILGYFNYALDLSCEAHLEHVDA